MDSHVCSAGATAATNSSVFILAAIGSYAAVFAPTAGNTATTTLGADFYFSPGKSMGFAPMGSGISLLSADISSSDAAHRLSWHLDLPSGGYRVGTTIATGMNGASGYRKVVSTAADQTRQPAAPPTSRHRLGCHRLRRPSCVTVAYVAARPATWCTSEATTVALSSLSAVTDGTTAASAAARIPTTNVPAWRLPLGYGRHLANVCEWCRRRVGRGSCCRRGSRYAVRLLAAQATVSVEVADRSCSSCQSC